MREEKLSDAIVYDKLHLLQKDFSGYIERNTAKVDANLPVFFGYVISALENSFPNLSDESHDEFVDSITFKVLDTSSNIQDRDFVKRVMVNAIRFKKRKNPEMGINIVVGLKLVKAGDYAHAIDFLKKYATLDAKLGAAVAYCYYSLSLREFRKDDTSTRNQRPGEMELLARELMINLARLKPPVGQLRQLELDDPAFLEKIFWQMIFIGFEWFSSEKWFVEVGLKNAAMTNDSVMRKRLLDIGSEHFYSDITFLREMYYYKLENRDAGGAAGIVNQLIKQYPEDLEPLYLGLKLSLLTTRKMTYHSFRKLALSKGMPEQLIELLDFSFELLNREPKEAINRLSDFEREFPKLQYFATVLRYIAADFSSGDEVRVKRAKKALLDSVDQYCTAELSRR
jgi:tetratricopeptide (TPR) repeat protein